MNTIHVLDATLRDGGNRVNFHFSDQDLRQILVPLDDAGIDYIEIGYRNGAIRPVPDLGRAGLCDKNYLLYCQSLIQRAKIAVMAHPQNITINDLIELKACGVNLLRICVSKGGIEAACPVIELSKQIGLEVSVNFIHASQYQDVELDKSVARACELHPDMIYFADSNGSLLPARVKLIYDKFMQRYGIPFGFHAHDNLGLAQANTIAAITAGVQFIDASVAGMGKGIGNLRTEFFIAYLHAMQIKKYNLETLVAATNYVRKAFNTEQDEIEMDEFIRGILDKSTAEMNQLHLTS